MARCRQVEAWPVVSSRMETPKSYCVVCKARTEFATLDDGRTCCRVCGKDSRRLFGELTIATRALSALAALGMACIASGAEWGLPIRVSLSRRELLCVALAALFMAMLCGATFVQPSRWRLALAGSNKWRLAWIAAFLALWARLEVGLSQAEGASDHAQYLARSAASEAEDAKRSARRASSEAEDAKRLAEDATSEAKRAERRLNEIRNALELNLPSHVWPR